MKPHLNEDPGPHGVFFPGCEGLEGCGIIQGGGGGRRRLVSQNIRVVTQNIRVITQHIRVITQNLRVITQHLGVITPNLRVITPNLMVIRRPFGRSVRTRLGGGLPPPYPPPLDPFLDPSVQNPGGQPSKCEPQPPGRPRPAKTTHPKGGSF